MIKLKSYSDGFLEEYWECVNKVIDSHTQKAVLASCINILPLNFFEDNVSLKTLILAPFEKLKEAETYIKANTMDIMKKECFDSASKNPSYINELYIKIYNSYKRVVDSQENKTSMRVRIVKNAELNVCPYCNRDYINYRAAAVSGAQLDHFFSKSEYPLFAVCIYNLVPSCGNCNRVKSNQSFEFASPFDNSINWEKDIVFSYDYISVDSIKVTINAKNHIQNNIKSMRIDEAYQIHDIEVHELIEKNKIYCDTQNQEFRDVLHKSKLTDADIKKAIFGPEITEKDMRAKPLGKMFRDLHKELDIY